MAFANISIRFLSVSIFFLCVISCSAGDDKDKDLVGILRQSFEQLYLVKFGKDFPANAKHLARCQEKQYEPCLKQYISVINSRDEILSLPREKALDEILSIISKNCGSQEEYDANYICYGGLISLYLYSEKGEDNIILVKIKSMNVSTLSLVLNGDFSWFHNRTNTSAWVEFVETAEVEWEYEDSKNVTLEKFLVKEKEAPIWVL